MARFNLADYETVEERIKRFYGDWPDGRILTENETIPEYRLEKIWVVRAMVYLNGEDVDRGCPKASGLAYEVDSASGPQAASALEVCETSARLVELSLMLGIQAISVPPVRRWRRLHALRRKPKRLTGLLKRRSYRMWTS
jgi:hypothetical protein